MTRTIRLVLMVAGGYLLWTYLKKGASAVVDTVEPLPPGAKPTGVTQRTSNAGAPGEEVVGYGIRDWAEIKMPSGSKTWVEVRVRNPFAK